MLLAIFQKELQRLRIMNLKLSFLTFLIVGNVLISTECYTLTDAQNLKEELFTNRKYDRTMRPIFNQSKAIEVDIYMGVTGITSFDMTTGKLISTGYLYVSWTDEQLLWNSSDFNGLSRLTISSNDIWTPNFVQGAGTEINNALAPAWISNNGTITWLVASSFEGDCILDVTRFPLDKHDCVFAISPSANDASEIQLRLLQNISGTALMAEHGEWEVTGSKAVISPFTEPISGTPFVGYILTVTLSRRYLFVIVHTSIPYCLLALLNTMIFAVPLRSGERVTFSMTILLAFIFFTSNISDDLPHNSLRLSYVSISMATLNIATALGITVSVILCRLDQETITSVPIWLKRLTFKYLRYRKRGKAAVTVVVPFETMSTADLNNVPNGKRGSFMKTRTTSIDDLDDIQWTHVANMLDYVLFHINFILMMLLGIGSMILLTT